MTPTAFLTIPESGFGIDTFTQSITASAVSAPTPLIRSASEFLTNGEATISQTFAIPFPATVAPLANTFPVSLTAVLANSLPATLPTPPTPRKLAPTSVTTQRLSKLRCCSGD